MNNYLEKFPASFTLQKAATPLLNYPLNSSPRLKFFASAENTSPQTNAAIDGIVAMKLYIDV